MFLQGPYTGGWACQTPDANNLPFFSGTESPLSFMKRAEVEIDWGSEIEEEEKGVVSTAGRNQYHNEINKKKKKEQFSRKERKKFATLHYKKGKQRECFILELQPLKIQAICFYECVCVFVCVHVYTCEKQAMIT